MLYMKQGEEHQHFVDALNATNIEGAGNNKPTIVLSAYNEITRLTGALELHKELASLSTVREQIVDPRRHKIHYEHPDVVAEAILKVVSSVDNGSSLVDDNIFWTKLTSEEYYSIDIR